MLYNPFHFASNCSLPSYRMHHLIHEAGLMPPAQPSTPGPGKYEHEWISSVLGESTNTNGSHLCLVQVDNTMHLQIYIF